MHPTLGDYLEILTRAVFQAGLSWALIDERWDVFQSSFEHFDVERVSQFDELDIDRIMATERMIHSRKKVVATIENARALTSIEREFGGVSEYLRCFGSYADFLSDASKRLAFLGDVSCYYWLFRTGNPVPPFDHWIATQPKDHPRVREMVLLGRKHGTSSERPGF
jgi:3-methyladenine DNA glycosylase Tag